MSGHEVVQECRTGVSYRSIGSQSAARPYRRIMRSEATSERIQEFLRRLGRAVQGPGTVFLTGGATALLLGWREATLDIDLSMDPEPRGAFEALARLKEDLDLNVEIVSPADFLPRLPGWRERCLFIESVGQVQFFHYDLSSQALSKLERGHQRDLADVRQMVRRSLVKPEELRRLLKAVEPDLVRFPAVDPDELALKVEQFIASLAGFP